MSASASGKLVSCAIASGAALLVVGCSGADTPGQEPRAAGRISYDYELSLPAEFKRHPVQGIDSKVEEWRSADTIISTDFGSYGAAPECYARSRSCNLSEERIGGRRSVVGRFRHGPEERESEPKPFRIFVHVPVDEGQRLSLNLFARCDNEAACNEALTYFRQVRLSRVERQDISTGPDGVPPPVPPPVRR